MFSGKTEEIIRRMRRAQIAGQRIKVFKPSVDARYHPQDIVAHNNQTRIPGTPVENSSGILMLSGNAEVIGIDEAQFFGNRLPDVAEKLAGKGLRVIIAGLDMDFKGQPFGSMPQLLSRAEHVTKLHAICVQCGGMASYSYRKTAQAGTIVLGEHDIYEARCRSCFFGFPENA